MMPLQGASGGCVPFLSAIEAALECTGFKVSSLRQTDGIRRRSPLGLRNGPANDRAGISQALRMRTFESRPVAIKFQLSDWTLISIDPDAGFVVTDLCDDTPPVDVSYPPAAIPRSGTDGFLARSLRVGRIQQVIRFTPEYVCYVPYAVPASLHRSISRVDAYKQTSPSKTRSTIYRNTAGTQNTAAARLRGAFIANRTNSVSSSSTHGQYPKGPISNAC